MSKTTDALHQAEAVLDQASIVTTEFQRLQENTSYEEWDKLTDGVFGELLMALTDLEYEVEQS